MAVSRGAATADGGYTWAITFLQALGDVPSLVPDALLLTGTARSITVAEASKGALPPFNSGPGGAPLGGAPCVALQLLGEGVVEKLAALVAQ